MDREGQGIQGGVSSQEIIKLIFHFLLKNLQSTFKTTVPMQWNITIEGFSHRIVQQFY